MGCSRRLDRAEHRRPRSRPRPHQAWAPKPQPQVDAKPFRAPRGTSLVPPRRMVNLNVQREKRHAFQYGPAGRGPPPGSCWKCRSPGLLRSCSTPERTVETRSRLTAADTAHRPRSGRVTSSADRAKMFPACLRPHCPHGHRRPMSGQTPGGIEVVQVGVRAALRDEARSRD
jgi:hypothetical protein